MPTQPHSKPLLFLIPHYVGSFKYFEKLLPFIAEHYEVKFLIIFGRKSYGKMLEYARINQHPFYAVEPPAINFLSRYIPFYAILKNHKHYTEEINKLLDKERPVKIIATNDQGFYSGYLMEQANQRQIDTMVLQWALTYPGQRILLKKETPAWRKFSYRFGKPLYLKIKNFLLGFVLDKPRNWSKGMIGGGKAKRLGVINEQTLEFFIERGIPKEKMTVVGYLDFYLSEQMKNQLANDKNKRQELAKRHNIDRSKRNIIFYSTPFNRKDIAVLTDQEQYQLTETIIKTLREICPQSEFDILFKPHPSEDIGQYQKLNRYGVKFMNPIADNNELIGLSELYIAGVSTTNFIPLAMNKDAIFVNLSKLPQIESGRSFFAIKRFITGIDELRSLLQSFKNNALEKQYQQPNKIITPDSLKKILGWIG
ncbi:MAG: polysialyltransferase family glycosyltransferase [Patescibacteria group bacterium]